MLYKSMPITGAESNCYTNEKYFSPNRFESLLSEHNGCNSDDLTLEWVLNGQLITW